MWLFSEPAFSIPLEKHKLKGEPHAPLRLGGTCYCGPGSSRAGGEDCPPTTCGHIRGGRGTGQWDAASEPFPQALVRENPKAISIWLYDLISAITTCLKCRVKLIQSQIYLGNI